MRDTSSIFFVATPYPGTELAEEFVKAGLALPDDYSQYRHLVTERRRGSLGEEDRSALRRNVYVSECRRAAREILISQMCDIRHYPELLRAYLRRHSLGEFIIYTVKKLGRSF